MITITLISLVLILIGFIIIATRLFFPYHAKIGLFLMISSIFFFLYSSNQYFKILEKIEYLSVSQNYILENKVIVFVILFLLVLIVTIIIINLLPFTKNPFKKMTFEYINEKINQDINTATILIDHLQIITNELLDSNFLTKNNYTDDEYDKLKEIWQIFLKAVFHTEHQISAYSYFYFFSPITQAKNHAQSFIIAYSLYLKQFNLIAQIIDQVKDNDVAKKILNEKISELKISNAYTNLAEKYYHPRTALRINIGQAYLQSFINKIYQNDLLQNLAFELLYTTAKQDYLFLSKKLSNTIINSFSVESDLLQKNIFSLWFPIQKNIAKTLGHTYLSNRQNKLISIQDIQKIKSMIEPGDIMLQRRNWYVSNIGIPGFWAHAALYTGTLADMDNYFASEFPYAEKAKMSDYLQEKFPQVFLQLNKQKKIFPAVIEAKEQGVILQPLEISANADYLAVLRPNISKKDKMLAILQAFSNYGKPYDFDFDFTTKNAMVCSELVYDAYQPRKDKTGINFSFSMINGRKIMPPIDIAKKFVQEYQSLQPELLFVCFLDGDELNKTAKLKGVEEFIQTINRPKYSFLLVNPTSTNLLKKLS